MSKRAEEAAKRIYADGIELVGRRDKANNIVIHPETMVGILRNAASRGYEQAEKDNTLTWEDVKRIVAIADMMMPNTAWDKIAFEAEFQTEEMFYKEVLKRYNNGKQ